MILNGANVVESRLVALALAIPLVILCFAATFYSVRFVHLIDARLHGERATVFPRVLARPLELRRGQSMTERQLIDRLNELGYAQRGQVSKPGEFAVGNGAIAILPRVPLEKNAVVRVIFQRPPAPNAKPPARRTPLRIPDRVQGLELGAKASERVTLDAPVLTALAVGEREKRRPVALAAILIHVLDLGHVLCEERRTRKRVAGEPRYFDDHGARKQRSRGCRRRAVRVRVECCQVGLARRRRKRADGEDCRRVSCEFHMADHGVTERLKPMDFVVGRAPISKPWPVAAESARAVRRTWPPLSAEVPSIGISTERAQRRRRQRPTSGAGLEAFAAPRLVLVGAPHHDEWTRCQDGRARATAGRHA
jgi:hypothetical protein